MKDLWYEAVLAPFASSASAEIVQDIKKEFTSLRLDEEKEVEDIKAMRGILRVQQPRWQNIDTSGKEDLRQNLNSRFYLVRLGFEFDVTEEARAKGAHFTSARCSALLTPATTGQPQPTVYDLFPANLFDGEQRKIGIKLGPSLKLKAVEASLVEASTELDVGFVEPSIVGFAGKNESEPYWRLTPQKNKLEGIQHLWLMIEAPGGDGVRLQVRANGEVKIPRLPLFPIPFATKSREWESIPSVLIN
jgi:hypothetical protein